MSFADFFKRVFSGGKPAQSGAPSQSPVAPATPVAAPTPAPTPAVAGAGGARGGPGTASPTIAGGAPDPKALQADRVKAMAELQSRFQIVDPATAAGGNLLPNQITQQQFEALAKNYSDIRMGVSNIKLDTGAMDPAKAQAFKDGTMNDIASMLQTGSGRDLIAGLANGVGKDGKVHTTTIGNTAPQAAMAAAADPSKEGLRQTTGTDMVAKYRPGADVAIGDPQKEPWWPQRSDVTLFHELTHALHGVKGTTQDFTTPNFNDVMKAKVGDIPGPTLMEEWSTVGLGPFAGDKITENRYREERRALGGQPGARAGDDASSMVRRERYNSYS